MSEIIKKSRYSPRTSFVKVTFNNDAIIAMSTDGNYRVLVPGSTKSIIFVDSIIYRTVLAVAYGDIDAVGSSAEVDFDGSFTLVCRALNTATNTPVTSIFHDIAPGSGYLQMVSRVFTKADMSGEIGPTNTNFEPNGNISIFIDNSVPFSGGDPANILEVYVNYWEVFL